MNTGWGQEDRGRWARKWTTFAWGAAVLATTGCGDAAQTSGDSGGSGGASSTTTATGGSGGAAGGIPVPFPAPHPDAPTVVNMGGPVLATPHVIPIFFSNDDPTLIAQVKDYTMKVPASSYWSAVCAGYGVGPLTSEFVDLAEPLTGNLDDLDIQAWLAGKLNADDPDLPPPDADSIYELWFPEGASFTIASDGISSCDQYFAYHWSTELDAAHGYAHVAYSVIARCPLDGYTTLEVMTGLSSHERIEAATDPFKRYDPAYADYDAAHSFWWYFTDGGEVADLCQNMPADAVFIPEDLGYLVVQSWSNAAADAGHAPCVPVDPSVPYFNSAPVFEDDVDIGDGFVSKGVHIPVGETRTVEIDLFSDAETSGPWSVEAVDRAEDFGAPAELTFAFDRTKGKNGDKLHVDITVSPQADKGYELFTLRSTLGDRTTVWYGIVAN